MVYLVIKLLILVSRSLGLTYYTSIKLFHLIPNLYLITKVPFFVVVGKMTVTVHHFGFHLQLHT